MEESILQSTKKVLGIPPEDVAFDLDVIIHINSAFSILHQLGIGPIDGFMISGDDETWDQFVDPSDNLQYFNEVKVVVYLRVRSLFDPPQTSYLISAVERQITEHEWRLNVMREGSEWTSPDPPQLEMYGNE
jgi:hypothetical protein